MDPSYLACAHHSVMLTSLQLVSYKSSLLLVGLGGGALATYIHTFFPEVTLTCLDIDEEMVKVAEKWFSFKSDAKLRSVVEDGIQFITKAEKKGEKYDIIMFDVDSKELSEGLSCPPRMFVEKEFLKKVANTLTKKGIFALNLVCRDPAIKKDIIRELKEVFGTVFSVAIPEEVNVVLFCRVAADSSLSERTFQDRIKTLNDYLKAETKSHTDVLELRDMMNSFQIVH
ncbi:UNVERIFIED_CONTAM: hypothetical protein GTU68_045025 [Idotea baltica]|nr:hypothetical protein [Idotea baltica]